MRALVFSAGAARTAYSAGAVKYLLGDLRIDYKIITGVSAGAIAAAFVAQYKTGQETQCANDLVKLWQSLTTKSIYQDWKFFGKIASLWKQGAYDNKPLINFIKSNISLTKIRASGKRVCVGTVNMSSGKYTIFDETSNDFIDAVIASTSFPAILPPVKIGNEWYSDGGSKEITPIKSAIDNSATSIDIILTIPEVRNSYYIDKPSIFDILKRAFDLSTDKIMHNDLEKLVMYNRLAAAGLCTDKKVIPVNIIRPNNNLLKDSFVIDPADTNKLIQLGYNDAKNKFII